MSYEIVFSQHYIMKVKLRFPEYAEVDFSQMSIYIAAYLYWFLADMHTWFNPPVSLALSSSIYLSLSLSFTVYAYPGRLSCRSRAGRHLVGKRTINCVLIICTLHAAGHSFVRQSGYLSPLIHIYLPCGRGCKNEQRSASRAFIYLTQTNFAIASGFRFFFYFIFFSRCHNCGRNRIDL